MTKQPQQEYIIKEADLWDLKQFALELNRDWWNKKIDEIRSHPHTPGASTERIGSIRTNIFMDEQKEWLIERVNAGMGEWEYVISYLGDHFATVPSEVIAREIVEMQCHTCPVFTPEHDATIRNQTLDAFDLFIDAHVYNDMTGIVVKRSELDKFIESLRHQSTEAPK